MPIIFRCKNCRQKLSITSRKAGRRVTCPSCSEEIQVPTLEQASQKKKRQAPVAVAESRSADRADQPPEDEAYDELSAAATGTATATPPDEIDLQPPPTAAPPADEDFDEVAEQALESLADEQTEAPAEDDFPPASDAVVREPAAAVAAGGDDEEDDEFTMRAPESEFDEMDLTPMVDVTFLLLIFFMITASFSQQKTLDVPPPDPEKEGASQAVSMEELQSNSIIVGIDENNVIYVDDEPLADPEALVDALADKMTTENKVELVLEAHEKALHEYVVLVIDAANEVKMQKIRIATRAAD